MNNANLISTAANVALFTDKSSDSKRNAQENLQGRTHYAEDSSLKFFKARIVSAHADADGLFFKMVESVALDYNNTRRGFRVVVFDLFGQVIYRPSLEDCASTQAAAVVLWMKSEKIDPAAYYRAELKTRANRLTNQAAAMTEAAAQLEGMPA
jgi:hypothetical protein